MNINVYITSRDKYSLSTDQLSAYYSHTQFHHPIKIKHCTTIYISIKYFKLLENESRASVPTNSILRGPREIPGAVVRYVEYMCVTRLNMFNTSHASLYVEPKRGFLFYMGQYSPPM